MPYYHISIIGSGNVAWHLAQALENAGHHIHEIYSRNQKNAAELVRKLYSTEAAESLDFSKSRANIFIMAISDDALAEVAADIILPAPDAVLVHTSGSVPMEILNAISHNHGVFYPLQSFVKSRKINLQETPILIEASNKETRTLLSGLAKTIVKKVDFLDSKKRMALHISAVFASNFTNHLLHIAQKLAKDHNIDYALLYPLIEETVYKSFGLGPAKAQTGPAARGDLKTLDNHLAFLQDEEVQQIYRVLSQHILDQRYYE